VNCHVEKQRRERTTIRTSGSAVRQVAWQLDMTSTCHRWWWWCDSCKYSIAGSMRQHPRFRCKHQAGKRCSTRPVLVRVMSATDRQLDQQLSSFCPLPLPPTESNRPRSHNLGGLEPHQLQPVLRFSTAFLALTTPSTLRFPTSASACQDLAARPSRQF
jgi:hypothetical protein